MNARNGHLPGAGVNDHLVMNFGLVRLESNLDMIQPGIYQTLYILRVFQAGSVGVYTGDLPVLFGMCNQLGQVFAQSRFASSKDNVWNTDFP